MRQLRSAQAADLGFRLAQGDVVDLGTSQRRLLAMPLIMLIAAGCTGYLGSFFRPPSYAVMVLAAAGGAAAAFLLFAVPAQTLLFLRKLLLRLRLGALRRALRSVLSEVRSTLTESPELSTSPAALGDLAIAEYMMGATEAAERDLGQALELQPEDPALLNNLGVVEAEAQHLDRAAEALARSCQLAPGAECRTNLALVAPLVEAPAAVEQLCAALPSQPDAMTLNNIGVFYMKRGQDEVAWEWFTRATRVDPNQPYPWANLGTLSYRKGRLREAVGHLITAERGAPMDARIANNLGVVLAAAGKPAWSRLQLQRAHQLEPANLGIRINRVSVQALEGHMEAAIRGLRALTAMPFHRQDAYYNLAVLQIGTGDYEGAAASAAAAIEEGERSADAYTNLAIALWETGRRAEALSHFQSAYQAEGSGPLAASNYGRALLLQGQPEKALAVLEPAREKWRADPDLAFDVATAILATVSARYHKGMTAAERRDFFVELHRSYAGLEGAVRRGAQAPVEARVNMGLYLYLREEYAAAAAEFELALKQAPELVELHHLAGTCYGRAADQLAYTTEDGRRTLTPDGLEYVRKAIPHFEAVVEAKEPSADAFYNLGRCYYALEEFEKALELFRRALRVENSEEMNSLAALAAAKQARQWQEAVRTQSLMSESRKEQLTARARQILDTAVYYFRQALLHNERNPTLHGNMGLAYMLRNQEHDVEAALRHWQRMRAIAGSEMETRFAEFTQIQSVEHASRVQFDESEVACRPLDVFEWVATLPPQPVGLHYVLEPVSAQEPWRLIAHSPQLQGALQIRDRIWATQSALARLEA